MSAQPSALFEPSETVDPVVEAYKRGVERTLLCANLRKSVQERVASLIALQRLAAEARGAGARITRPR